MAEKLCFIENEEKPLTAGNVEAELSKQLELKEQIMLAAYEWQSTFDAISDSIALIGVDQRVKRCNLATCNLLGRESAAIINKHCCELFHGTDEAIHDCPMVRAMHSLQTETLTYRHFGRWLEETVNPILSGAGILTGAVHIVRDVTERVKLVNSLQESSELFRLFMKHSPIYTFIKEVTDTESRFIEASDNFWDMIGIRSKDMIGKSMQQLFPKKAADKMTADDQRVVAAKEVLRLEETFNEGSYITYKFPIEREDGKRLLAGYTIDITDRKRLENELFQERALYKDLVDTQPAGMYLLRVRPITTCDADGWRQTVDSHYSFDMVSARFCEILGVDAKTTRDNPGIVPDMVFLDDRAGFIEKNVQALSTLTPFKWEGRFGNEQNIIWVRFESVPRKLNSGDVLWTGVVTDISDDKRAENNLRDLHAQLLQQDKLATIGQLAAGVAHEINNPIGFVSSNMVTLAKYIEKYDSYIDMIEQEIRDRSEGVLPAQILELRRSLKLDYVMLDIKVLVDESNEGIERVKRIVQDLRIFSRSDTATYGKADLNQCLDSTINIIMNEIKYSAELRREYGNLPLVSCNVQQINQVFMNLLINAVHAIQAKGEEIGEIVIRSWSDVDNVFVVVADNGCGIAPENRGRIFDAFFTTKEIGKGTGLGLSISENIIRKHGGEITVASEEGKGSTFTVRLPLKPAQAGGKPQ